MVSRRMHTLSEAHYLLYNESIPNFPIFDMIFALST